MMLRFAPLYKRMEVLEGIRSDIKTLPAGKFLFVSYSHDDRQIVENIIDSISINHFRLWYDKRIESGSQWDDIIWDHIKDCCQCIVFISRTATESTYVKDEIRTAKSHNKPFLTVYLEDIELTRAFALHLSGSQSIKLSSYKDKIQFTEKLISSLNKRAYEEIQTKQNKARQLLEERYLIERQIGAGGTSKVYLAYGKNTGSKVAIKHGIIDNTHTAHMIMRSIETDRKILSLKICPFSPELIDYYRDDENIFLVESFIDGQTLSSVGSFSVFSAVSICLKLAHVIEYFHENGLVHNDIKPANVMINSFGDVFILDFTSMTREGKKADPLYTGTIGFTAPELFDPAITAIDRRSDIYCLGRTLHYMLAKKTMADDTFNIDDSTVILEPDYENTIAILGDEDSNIDFSTTHLDQCGIHDEILDSIVQKMTAIDPNNRFSDMRAVQDVLKDHLDILKIADRMRKLCDG